MEKSREEKKKDIMELFAAQEEYLTLSSKGFINLATKTLNISVLEYLTIVQEIAREGIAIP